MSSISRVSARWAMVQPSSIKLSVSSALKARKSRRKMRERHIVKYSWHGLPGRAGNTHGQDARARFLSIRPAGQYEPAAGEEANAEVQAHHQHEQHQGCRPCLAMPIRKRAHR